VKRAYERMNAGDAELARDEFAAAAEHYEAAQEAVPDNVEFTFWRAVMLANFGRIDEARTFLERTNDAPGDWTELLRRLPAAGLLPEEVVSKLGG
jgi:tetratricopeptide (TPR) repeat protein